MSDSDGPWKSCPPLWRNNREDVGLHWVNGESEREIFIESTL